MKMSSSNASKSPSHSIDNFIFLLTVAANDAAQRIRKFRESREGLNWTEHKLVAEIFCSLVTSKTSKIDRNDLNLEERIGRTLHHADMVFYPQSIYVQVVVYVEGKLSRKFLNDLDGLRRLSKEDNKVLVLARVGGGARNPFPPGLHKNSN
jgi:hypothetical protein